MSAEINKLNDILNNTFAGEKIREESALLNIATDAIYLRDLENRILFWNQGAENLYGFSAAEIIGENNNNFLYKDTSRLKIATKTTVESGFWQSELTKVRKDGKEVIVASRWTLICDTTRQPKSIVIVDSDITDKKQLEQQFYKTQRLEILGTFVSSITHDLNNVLTPILAISQLLLLKLKNFDGYSQELLKTQELNAKHAAELVKKIPAFVRGTENQNVVIQLKQLLIEIENFVRKAYPKSIDIETNIADDLATIIADATQLRQIFINLVVNARDAMPNGGKLTIAASNVSVNEDFAKMNMGAKPGDYILITITDTGVGISSGNIKRIFEPFFTTKDVGTGLGLSTTFSIVINHNGFINVFSELGKGSRFQVYLPASNNAVNQ